MRPKKIVWIDDTTGDRKFPGKVVSKQYKENLGYELEIFKLESRQAFGSLLKDDLSVQDTAAVIMDYQLPDVGEGNRRQLGTTWAADIRTDRPGIPVIGTSYEPEKDIPRFSIENFLAFYPRERLCNRVPWDELKALIHGFRTLRAITTNRSKREKIDLLVDEINPPSSIRDITFCRKVDMARISGLAGFFV